MLEKEMATDSSTTVWQIPWTEEPDRLQSMGLQESDMTERLHFHAYIYVCVYIYFQRNFKVAVFKKRF